MSDTNDVVFNNQYSGVLRLLLEQRGAKLRPVVDIEAARGEKHFFDRIGNFTATEVTSRNMPLPLQDAAFSRRMTTLTKHVAASSIDDLDNLQRLIDPANAITTKIVNALGRQFDEVVISAILGTAASGKSGTDTTAYDTTMDVPADGTGLTCAKIHTALSNLEARENDMENDSMFLIVSAAGLKGLMNDPLFTNHDYQDVKALSGKQIPMYRGLRIIRSQNARLATTALIVTGNAVKVAMAEDIRVKVKDQPSLVDVTSIHATLTMGAVRMEEGCVSSVLYV